MLKLDLHVHSIYSEDGEGSPKEIINSIQKKGLNGLAFTDHNTVKGGLKALKICPKNFIVIPGVEISTKDGHVIALNVKESPPRGLSSYDTVEKILDMGGTPIIPHLYRNMSGIKKDKLKLFHKKISAIEVYNSCSQPYTNLKMARTAQELNLGGTGGSDSHIPKYAGYAYTNFDTTDYSIDSIISMIERKKTWGEGEVLPLDYRKDRMVKSLKQFFQRGFKKI